MQNNLRTIYRTSDTIKDFDKRTFIASVIFFFVALVNIRDFPIHNVPLIYPTFIFFVLVVGHKRIVPGFRKTRLLYVVNTIYWVYLILLRLIKGMQGVPLVYFAYIIESFLIFGAAGMATTRSGGTKSALWAIIFVITFSTASGTWIYFIGEPMSSLRVTLQSSIGGDLLSGTHIRENDLQIEKFPTSFYNTGLSYFAFQFSYQLALVTVIMLMVLLSEKAESKKHYIIKVCILIILVIGIITNSERTTLFSVPIGLLSFFWIKKRKVMYPRAILLCIIGLFAIISLKEQTMEWKGANMYRRRFDPKNEKTIIRSYIVPLAALSTLVYEPMGAGWLSENYIRTATKFKWLKIDGSLLGVHHHFASLIMYTGIIGLSLIVVLGHTLWKLSFYMRNTPQARNGLGPIFAAATITCIFHSFTHNAGFFNSDPGILIVSGLLLSIYKGHKKRRKRKVTNEAFNFSHYVG